MQNYENIIEKYRRELLEFSRQNAVHRAEETEEREAVATVAEPMNASADADENPDDPEPTVGEVSVADDQGPYRSYEDFLRRNPARGLLRVQVMAGGRSFPVPEADVNVVVRLESGDRTVFSGKTDNDGIIDDIKLPAPDSNRSMDENSVVAPFAVYDIDVTHPRFAESEYKNVPVFDSVKSIQVVDVVPKVQGENEPGATVYDGQPSELFRGER